jgi:hypothetical protein
MGIFVAWAHWIESSESFSVHYKHERGLLHFTYPEIFFSQTKKAYISLMDKERIVRLQKPQVSISLAM